MNTNDILRRLRYVFDLSDSQMMAMFGNVGREVTRAEISDWLKKDDDPAFKACPDVELATFLNGFIVEKRGPGDGPPRPPEERLTNNIVLTKLKIALSLKSEDIMAILALMEFYVSKHELTALSRKPGHKHFRECQDQLLRNFLQGLQRKYRPQVQEDPQLREGDPQPLQGEE
jgi:uncharacterized protein YehS (DUF1456 family)